MQLPSLITFINTNGGMEAKIGSFKVIKPEGYDENRTITRNIENGGQTLTLVCANTSSG